MQTSQGRREALIVAREASKATDPGETALEDPASRPIGRFVSVMLSVLSRVLT